MHGHTTPATRRRRGTRLALVATLALAASGCWPAPGQGPDRASYNPFETTITPDTVRTLAPVWTATTDSVETGGVVGPPVVSNVAVHVSDGTALFTFDKATGARLWRSPEPPTFYPFIADPLADGNRVLLPVGFPTGFGGSWTGYSQWLDARTGVVLDGGPALRVDTRRGTRMAGYSATGGPGLGALAFGLEVVDTADPAAGWSRVVRLSFDDLSVGRSATLGSQRLYYAGAATESYEPFAESVGVRAFPLTPPATCVVFPPGGPSLPDLPCPLWATTTAARPVTSPVLGPGESVLYVGTSDGTLLALDAADGHVLWTAALGAAPSADPALADGWLYVPLADGDLAVLPAGGCGAATCDAAWRAHLGGAGLQPAVAGGVVFVGTDAGDLVALRAPGCGRPVCYPVWQRDFGAPITGAPAVTGGRVYVGVSPDKVVALAPTSPP